ncbi:BglG family transcription antiterminator LicT [Vagococcus xieshaowenii]|uniref:PRD domain-containing protein n=1 Tax=Vagococcus xieshaowenii TaxID=2562451 RepID=A0AAJ5EFN9_9ENTE|nr:PRD domain-containing protein [Vagococcus xieshaowenii]QCA27965.1 PRD domain-containing protein [Vagococcus xieshaowenii]TFZ41268.1 PRD domain-containing protein [Vagococcus xieshaowenii]
MKIIKILNNNAAVCQTEDHQEIICFGKGIAFQRKAGETIETGLIDKKFLPDNADFVSKYQQIVSVIPDDYVKLADQVIDNIKQKLGKSLNDNIYISLTDHIFAAVKRYEEGVSLTNTMLWDIKRFYPAEFKLGQESIEMIGKVLGVSLPEDEAGFIAFHIVNSELDEQVENTYQITRVMTEVLHIVTYHFNVTLDEESVYYYRFITHMKFLAQRLLNGSSYQEGGEDPLFQTIKTTYPVSFDCANKVNDFLNKKYHLNLSEEELSYLTIHLDRLIYKTK